MTVHTPFEYVVNMQVQGEVAARLNSVMAYLNMLRGQNSRFIEEFGVTPQPHGTLRANVIDQRNAIQAAIDWSAANQGAPILLSPGIYGVNSPLHEKSDAKFIGPPGGDVTCKILCINNTYPDVFHIPLANRLAMGGLGVGAMTFMNLCIDGGWDKKAQYGVGNNWDFSCRPFNILSVSLTNPAVFTVTSHNFFNGLRVRIKDADTNPNSAVGVGVSLLNCQSLIVRNVAGNTFNLEDEAGNLIDASTWSPYTANSGEIHAYAQKGLEFDAPGDGSNDNNYFGFNDPHNTIHNVHIQNIAGTGLHTEGRGEMFFGKIWVSSCAYGAVEFNSFDNWIMDATVHVCGRFGWRHSGGNCRIANLKSWFIGYALQDGASPGHGAGIQFLGNNLSNVTAANLTVQDTWGDGIEVEGHSNYLIGGCDNIGSLGWNGRKGDGTSDSSFTWGPVKTNERHSAVKMSSRNTYVLLQLCQRTSVYLVQPRVAYFDGSASGNCIELAGGRSNTDFVPWYEAAPVAASTGNNNIKAHNKVSTKSGLILWGNVTTAKLLDITDQLNNKFHKSAGTRHWATDVNKWFTATGTASNAIWVAGDNTTLTPV